MTRQELEREFASGDGERIQAALSNAFRAKNCVWVESRCLYFLGVPNPTARRGAARILGKLATAYSERIDLVNTQEALLRLSRDEDKSVRAAVKGSLDTVKKKLKLQKKRR